MLNEIEAEKSGAPTGSDQNGLTLLQESPDLEGVTDQAKVLSVISGVLSTTVQVLIKRCDSQYVEVEQVISKKWIDKFIESCEALFELQFKEDSVL